MVTGSSACRGVARCRERQTRHIQANDADREIRMRDRNRRLARHIHNDQFVRLHDAAPQAIDQLGKMPCPVLYDREHADTHAVRRQSSRR
jgi:hypothetical protein